MALIKSFSRRMREAAGPVEVYEYESCQPKLREQIFQMIRAANEIFQRSNYKIDLFSDLNVILRKELGVRQLSNRHYTVDEFDAWFTSVEDIPHLLDAIEFASSLISYYSDRYGIPKVSREFDEELNARMAEAGFGYRLEGHEIIRIDSEYVHSEVIAPTLTVLRHPDFAQAETEFRQAHEEYRHGHYEDSIHDCCNALESVLKVILTKKGWSFLPTDTASKLLAVAFQNNLIPQYMQTEFAGLRTILESGTPTVRNKTAGHGAGTNPRNIPRFIAAFQLHQTAAAILLLTEAAR